ncbi:unnamed protein product [Ranitomeya imitator]|uniref:Uncharacterized protein n=1 Tax=Ranitomeya imitator TaxID=111125 RepID=A0ABN9LBI1_9NEOB|nr:unnamed protein product [Ranitomeya imitator]
MTSDAGDMHAAADPSCQPHIGRRLLTIDVRAQARTPPQAGCAVRRISRGLAQRFGVQRSSTQIRKKLADLRYRSSERIASIRSQSLPHRGSIDEDVVVIEASSTPQVPGNNEEINVTSTDSEVEIVTVGESYRSRSSLGHSRSHWGQSSSSQSGRSQEHRSRSRVSTVIQPLRQNATEVVDLTVDEDDPTVVPTTSGRTESQPVSTVSSDSSTSEPASDAVSGPWWVRHRFLMLLLSHQVTVQQV